MSVWTRVVSCQSRSGTNFMYNSTSVSSRFRVEGAPNPEIVRNAERLPVRRAKMPYCGRVFGSFVVFVFVWTGGAFCVYSATTNAAHRV